MNIRMTLATTLLLATASIQTAHATLSNGSVLSFSAALGGHNAIDTVQPAAGTGSWWAFPVTNFYLAVDSFNGLIVGATQLAGGSHNGLPDGSESPAIDLAWGAFGSTGMLEMTTPSNIISASGNTASLDFSGASVDWNGIEGIPLYDPVNFPADTGMATIVCAVDCGLGDTYTLDYIGHTALTGNPIDSQPFLIHLEGTITAVPLPAAVWMFGAGLLGMVGIVRRKRKVA